MSSLYEATVLQKVSPTVVDVNIRVVHPDAMHISATAGFVVMLLQESAHDGAPILKEIDFDSASDATWLRKYATGFVTNVETLSSKNVPPEGWYFDNDHEYWKREEWLSSVIRITVTHQDWLQHLSEGSSWHGASYEPNSTYDLCDPVLPENETQDVAQSDADDRAGFLPIPTFFYPNLYGKLPSPVWIPKYGPAAYIADETFSGDDVTQERINAMIGKPVLFTSWGSQDIGIVASEELVSTISTSSWGQTGISAGSGEIGIARFNTSKKRLNEALTYSGMLDHVEPLIESVSVKGNKATLTIICVNPDKKLNLESSSDALAMLVKMEYESFDGFENAESKLGQFLYSEMTENDISFEDDAFCIYAGGIIKSFSISKTTTGENIDFDAMENDELLLAIERKPWTTWTATIEVSDPNWIEHLSSETPFPFGFDWLEKAQAWEGKPILWSAPK